MKALIKDDFKDLLDYRNWINERFNSLTINREEKKRFEHKSIEREIKGDPNWFGNGTTYDELANGITEYKNPDLIQKVYDMIQDRISVDVRERLKAPRINYNAMGLGVFVFDRAAIGMFRNKELFSISHKKVVNEDDVHLDKNPMLLKSDNTSVIERWEEKENGKKKIRTNSKKVFAWFPPQNKPTRAVEMIISAGGHSGISATEFLYSGIAAIVIAELLEKAKIKSRISIMVGTSDSNDIYCGCRIPIKDFQQTLDKNLLALLTSDPRFYRYEGFKGLLAVNEEFGRKIPSGYGLGPNKNALRRILTSTGYVKNSLLTENVLYFGRTFTESETLKVISEGIETVAKMLNE